MQNIGHICPDSTINFQSTKTAEEYAKNVVVKAARPKILMKNPEAAKIYTEQNLNLYNKLLQESISEAVAKNCMNSG